MKSIVNSNSVRFVASGILAAAIIGAVALFPTHVQAATTINLSPTNGVAGSKTAVTGDGFIGKLATIYWDDAKLVQNVPVSKGGQISFSFEIPPSSKGEHTVKVTDDSNWSTINASSTFSINPGITVEPPWGKPPTTVTIIGRGFGSREAGIKALWEGKALTRVPIQADKDGTWYASFPIPNVDRGEYTIAAQGESTGPGEAGEVTFTVAPFARATPLSGPVGTKILVTGAGFRAGEDGLTFTWDGPIFDMNLVAQANGTFSTTLTVPPSSKGKHILGTYGSSFTPKGIVPDIEFEVTPSLKLTPSDIVGSRELRIEGWGFNASESISISYDKASTGVTATSDATGSFVAKIQMPGTPGKEHTVTATGAKGAVAQATHAALVIVPPAPQLLFPGPGAKIQPSDSAIDVAVNLFKGLGNTGKGNKGAAGGNDSAVLTALNWNIKSDVAALKYSLQISRTADFASVVYTKDSINGQSLELTRSNLPAPGAYYWRVRAVDDVAGGGPWSNYWTFEITPASTLGMVMAITVIALLIAAIIFAAVAAISRRRYS